MQEGSKARKEVNRVPVKALSETNVLSFFGQMLDPTTR